MFTTSIGVDAVFATIAQSLTRYFRTVSNQAATGTTESLEQYIQGRWEWLLVPLAMVTLNAGFVLAVRLQSHRLGLPSWRNSVLALMLRETTAEEEEELGTMQRDRVLIGPPGPVDHISDLEKWAGTRLAYFLRGGGIGDRVRLMAENDN